MRSTREEKWVELLPCPICIIDSLGIVNKLEVMKRSSIEALRLTFNQRSLTHPLKIVTDWRFSKRSSFEALLLSMKNLSHTLLFPTHPLEILTKLKVYQTI